MSFQNPLPPGIRQVVPDYISDGVALVWGFPFRLFAPADLYVGVRATIDDPFTALTLGVDFTITIAGLTSALVTLTTPQPTGTFIRIMGLRVPSRTTSVVNDGVVQSAPFEAELDVIEATMQELRRDCGGGVDTGAEPQRAMAAEAALANQINFIMAVLASEFGAL
jgi:hypothetical protein